MPGCPKEQPLKPIAQTRFRQSSGRPRQEGLKGQIRRALTAIPALKYLDGGRTDREPPQDVENPPFFLTHPTTARQDTPLRSAVYSFHASRNTLQVLPGDARVKLADFFNIL